MKIALVQMSMGKEISDNLDKSLKYCDMAENCDLVFFPEIQVTPFFSAVSQYMCGSLLYGYG